ncbi:MAG: hypothetical protein MN733_32250 [Nitrososphaera sp.]|nr:hypothetical protein [Nitrososphaera sp.]
MAPRRASRRRKHSARTFKLYGFIRAELTQFKEIASDIGNAVRWTTQLLVEVGEFCRAAIVALFWAWMLYQVWRGEMSYELVRLVLAMARYNLG